MTARIAMHPAQGSIMQGSRLGALDEPCTTTFLTFAYRTQVKDAVRRF